ncbi:hypothetical protein [Streptomyces sp. NPDC048185]|uniref:hypothetical protein n=1 Tax=Streptomyces sp. NPDC048185 TaxID=3365508 RepID=UPI003713CA1F
MSPKKQNTAAQRARAAAREGAKYTAALRADTGADIEVEARSFPGDGGPWVSSWTGDSFNDVNAACGHHLKALCGGCGVCTTCDGCYCAEAAENARIDAETNRAYAEHAEHFEHRSDCYLCEDDREKTADYTRCWKCGLEYRDGIGDHHWHNPPYCTFGLPTYPLGVDWGYLRGQEVTLVGREYSVHGLVLADQDAPDPQKYFPVMKMRRTDPGYEDGPDETSPINPREWLEVHPAPETSAPGR